MAFSQTTFGDAGIGHEGRVSSSDHAALVRHYFNDEAAATIPFGRAVIQASTAFDAAKFPSALADTFIGVTLADDSIARDTTLSEAEYPINRPMKVLQRGRVFVKPEQTVVPGDSVFVRVTAGAGTKTLGRFRKDGDTAVAAVLRQQTLTLSGALDGGRPQIETLTWDGVASAADGTKQQQTLIVTGGDMDGGRRQRITLTMNQAMVAGETVTFTVDGTVSIGAIFSIDNDTSLERLVSAIKAAGEAAATAAGGQELSTIEEVNVVPVAPNATDDRIIEVISRPGAATVLAQGGITVTTAAGLTCTRAIAAGEENIDPSLMTVDLGAGADTVEQEFVVDHDTTLNLFAEKCALHASVESATVLLVPGGPNDQITLVAAAVGVAGITVAANAITGGVTALTLPAVITVAGTADGVADTYALTVDATPIALQTMDALKSHDEYFEDIAHAILQAGVAAGAGPAGSSSIESCIVRPTTGLTEQDARVIEITSKPGYATVFGGSTWTTAGATTVVPAAAQANANPHDLAVNIDGVTYSIPWQGTHDATFEAFARELVGAASVSAAAVTQVAGGDDLVITVTSATGGPTITLLAAALANNGVTPRTLTIGALVAGVAAVAAQAAAWAKAKWVRGAAADGIAELEIDYA